MNDGTLKVEKVTESKQPPASSMTEAGFSMNVKMFDEHGQEVMLTFRCAYASNSNYLLGHYTNTVKDLLEKGWQASKPGARSSASGASNNGAPRCPDHNAPMKESKHKPGTYFCPRKDGNDDYCRHKA